MTIRTATILASALAATALAAPAHAQLAGEVYIHDPSTLAWSDGRWWTFGTGGGGLSSEDGWTWEANAERPGGGVAPDTIKIGDRFLVGYAIGGGGMSGGHASDVKTMWTKSLDPSSPDFGFSEPVTVAQSTGYENHDAIDIAFLMHDGHLYATFGTYFGSIRMIELDPATGGRLAGTREEEIAIDMEATAMMYRDGWFYLLGTHGTCCDSINSTYNIRVGRSRDPFGPYVDNMGVPLLRGGGRLVAAAHGRTAGAGHFGLIDLGDDMQKFSMHYEADFDRSGHSVLAIEPLLWENGWPVAGTNIRPGTYEINSLGSGNSLQLKTDFVRIPHERRRGFRPAPGEVVEAIPGQSLADVEGGWPDGTVRVDLSHFMVRPNQKWTITPATDKGGFMGAPYYRITIEGTDRTLAATANREVEAVPAYTGDDAQLWRIDQLIDGTYRITPKLYASEGYALNAIGRSTVSLTRFDAGSDAGRWRFNHP